VETSSDFQVEEDDPTRARPPGQAANFGIPPGGAGAGGDEAELWKAKGAAGVAVAAIQAAFD